MVISHTNGKRSLTTKDTKDTAEFLYMMTSGDWGWLLKVRKLDNSRSLIRSKDLKSSDRNFRSTLESGNSMNQEHNLTSMSQAGVISLALVDVSRITEIPLSSILLCHASYLNATVWTLSQCISFHNLITITLNSTEPNLNWEGTKPWEQHLKGFQKTGLKRSDKLWTQSKVMIWLETVTCNAIKIVLKSRNTFLLMPSCNALATDAIVGINSILPSKVK